MGGKLLGGRRVERKEVERYARIFGEEYVMYVTRYEIAGSYRRGKEDCGDVDIVACVPHDRLLMFNLDIQKRFGCPWQYARKSFLWDDIQFEIYVCFEEFFGAMLMHATGSGGYNAGLRRYCAERGMKLNQYGLWIGDLRIAGKTEEGIYERLGKPYKAPEDRK